MSSINYTPPPSLVPFFTSEKMVSLVVGPIGSTKTTASLLKIAYHAARVAPCRDGIRRSRCVVVRNTREQLRDTTIPDFLSWYPDGVAGTYIKTEMKFILRFGDVECEVLFRGLDEAKDVRKLLSLQISFAVMDEFRELHPEVFEQLQGRLGRYPDKKMVPPDPSRGFPGGCVYDDGTDARRLWGASNPPDMDTYWEKYISSALAGELPSTHVTIQPSGVSPEADWVQHLPEGYYETLMEGKSEEWIDVYVHAKFGKSLAGRPVFSSFNPEFHIAKHPLQPFRSSESPLLIGMDFGLTPACTINQLDPRGRLLTYDSLVSEGMGILRFLDEKLLPLLSTKYAGIPVLIIGDPAGAQRAQTDERSVFDIIRGKGLKVIPAPTNSISARIAAVEALLSRQVDGSPAHIFDPGAKEIIQAMRGGYRYRKRKDGEYEDKPEKNKYSHVADAHQYACLHVARGSDILPGRSRGRRRDVQTVSMGGWV